MIPRLEKKVRSPSPATSHIILVLPEPLPPVRTAAFRRVAPHETQIVQVRIVGWVERLPPPPTAFQRSRRHRLVTAPQPFRQLRVAADEALEILVRHLVALLAVLVQTLVPQ